MPAILPVRAAFASARDWDATLLAEFLAASAARSVSLQACSRLITTRNSFDSPISGTNNASAPLCQFEPLAFGSGMFAFLMDSDYRSVGLPQTGNRAEALAPKRSLAFQNPNNGDT
ncbi:MAG: hypothetical protein OXC26_09725 [Albidovulum sp.]|nr:hypothetical protein [Albidovulum sp.]